MGNSTSLQLSLSADFKKSRTQLKGPVYKREGLHIKLKLYSKNLVAFQRIIAFTQVSTRAAFGHFGCVFDVSPRL